MIDLVNKYGNNVPRYTSYPTAVDFLTEPLGEDVLHAQIATLATTPYALYAHIPYCPQGCLYCGCNKIVTQQQSIIENYLHYLLREVEILGAIVPTPAQRIYLGGGTPNSLSITQLSTLIETVTCHGLLAAGATTNSLEVDPRTCTPEWIASIAPLGFNRVSMGVQDFDKRVQQAIGRQQSFEQTKAIIDTARSSGIDEINVDLVYGLPDQTICSLYKTIQQVITLAPDQVALFHYAHLPSRIKSQRLIDESSLPTIESRMHMQQTAAQLLQLAGYQPVGIDHFQRRDPAQGPTQSIRSFQGYEDGSTRATLGIGASAISQLPGAYWQNHVKTPAYRQALMDEALPIARQYVLNDEDQIRRSIILDLLTFGRAYIAELSPLVQSAELALRAQMLEDGIIKLQNDELIVVDEYAGLTRQVAATFDTFDRSNMNFSKAV